MKKYSLGWWFNFGNMDKKKGLKQFKHIKKNSAKLAYKIGYWTA